MSGDDVPKPYVTIDFGSVELPIEETDGVSKSRPSDETVGPPVNLDFLTNSQGRGSANNANPQHGDSMHHLEPQAQDENCVIPIGSPRKQNSPGVPELRKEDAGNRDEEKQLKNLMVVRSFLVQQLNSFSVALTLLVAVTAVAILQPPGSFDNEGHVKPCTLVACFLFFSSLSFLLACCGLMAAIVGSAALFRPWFLPNFEDLKNVKDMEVAGTGDGIVQYDEISTLGHVIQDNIWRVRRIRIYLILSLGLCMLAFVCGAFAILGSAKCSQYLVVGTICGGGLVLAVEIGVTFGGPSSRLPSGYTSSMYQKNYTK